MNKSQMRSFHDGQTAVQLKKNLGNFASYAERIIEQLDTVFELYPEFRKMLEYMAQAECGGCRKEKCKFIKIVKHVFRLWKTCLSLSVRIYPDK